MSSAPSESIGSPSQDERTWAMVAHLTGLVGFIGPLIVWLVKKDGNPFVEDQAKESLNFQITMLIGYVVSVVLSFLCIGFFVAIGLLVANVVFCILGGLKANEGITYRYPYTLRLIK